VVCLVFETRKGVAIEKTCCTLQNSYIAEDSSKGNCKRLHLFVTVAKDHMKKPTST
jgi:hypothetical protein